jgi:hypothetical protein
MRHGVWLILACLSVSVFALVSLTGDRVRAVPPLSLEGFLDEKLPEPPEEPDAVRVDNFACYVCHANYQTEDLARTHARAGIGCVQCHGRSLEHCDDEAHETPPDIMIPPHQIAEQCGKCHKTHDAPPNLVLARYLERVPAKTDPTTVLCTDCHGQHRLPRRSVWWDYDTRKMVLRKDGQRYKVRPDWSVPPGSAP